jgi:outer membrane protein assembly factor BamE (lipoprotein component of BamABCDE complex)
VKNPIPYLRLVTSLGAVFLAGCESPDSRIRENPAAFARLPADQQALVKAGQVGVGMDMETVKLAIGEPSRVTLHTDSKGQVQVWHYVIYEGEDGAVIYTGFHHRPWGWGGAWAVDYPAPVRVHDRLKIVFDANGRVGMVDQDAP